MQICLLRMLVASVSFVVIDLFTGIKKLKINPKDIWVFVCTGVVSVVFFNVCYFYTVIHSQSSIAVVLMYTSPIFIMILSAIFFKEKITLQKVIALLLTFAGCVLVAGVFGGGYRLAPLVLLTGIGSGLFYGLYTIFGRVALKKYDAGVLTTYTFIFGFIGSLPIGNIPKTVSMLIADPVSVLWFLGIGIVGTVLPYFFYTWGLKRMESSKASILVAVEPVVGSIVGMTVFQESRDVPKIIGIALIIAAIVLMNINFRLLGKGKEKSGL